ncbi:hypothetical protein ZTR_11083 [Talaromyces verruculosus]|nr:hypothetical protein ZTR_11083 [Talaromyces verruculosus]
MLLYDRFGTGKTVKKDTAETHDAMDAAKDLRELIVYVAENHLQIPSIKIDSLPIIFVGHSFGGVIAELYARKYPKTVVALLLLDPSPTDSNGDDWFPNPDAPDFKPEILPDGITPAMVRKARALHFASPYNRDMPNKEGITWDNLSTYIPKVGAPQLIGPWESTPLLTIMAHDPKPYAEQVKKIIGTPPSVTLIYNSPNWIRYLEKLANLVPPHLRKGPIVAKGSGHFIPLEQPRLVALELKEIIQKLQRGQTSKL